jgi:hypothetical protein
MRITMSYTKNPLMFEAAISKVGLFKEEFEKLL